MSMTEARTQERRVSPAVWTRKGGVQRGLEKGKRRDRRYGKGRIRRRHVRIRRV
jgi:hypothetical protein